MSRDHYVPRHYLRQFTISGSKLIAAANVSPYKFRGVNGIKGECQETDFEEGDTGLSNALKWLENQTAPKLAEVVKEEDYTLEQRDALRWLAAALHMRTKKAAEAYKVFPTHICHEVIQNEIDQGNLPPPPEGRWTKEMIDWGGVPRFLVGEVLPCALHMQNLGCKLLKAPSGAFFITSDNPVVILNQFCEKEQPLRSFVGFGRAGFQLLLPLSPRLSALFYDAKIYKLGSPRHRVMEINAQDTEIINALQIQSADSSLYFHDSSLEVHVSSLVAKYDKYRVPVEHWLRTIPGRNENEEFLHFRTPSGRLPMPWAFCRVRRDPTLKVGDLRDPLGSALIDALMDDYEKNPTGGDMHSRFEKIVADPSRLKNVHIV